MSVAPECASSDDRRRRATRSVTAAPAPRIDRYVLTACVESGAGGEIFRAYDPSRRCEVVVRLMRDGADQHRARRTLAEARALTSIVHPNVQRLLDVGNHWGRVFVVHEWSCDVSLATWLREARPERERFVAVVDAGRGLAAAHTAGVIHGDFSPIRARVACDGRVRVTDFAAELGLRAHPLGTAAYMAPELFDGAQPTEASDQFAFCVAAFVALTGGWPHQGATYEARCDAVRAGRFRAVAGQREVASTSLGPLLRGLSVDPQNRWGAMDDLLDALAQ